MRSAFAAATGGLATQAAGREVQPLAGRRSGFASWFQGPSGERLIVVVPPHQQDDALDEVLAHALAWQHDRDLVLVVHTPDAGARGLQVWAAAQYSSRPVRQKADATEHFTVRLTDEMTQHDLCRAVEVIAFDKGT